MSSINVSAAKCVAGMAVRDLWRRPGTWTTTLLTGVLFAVLFVGLGAVNARSQERAELISFNIAVDGDVEDGQRFVDAMRTDRLLPTKVEDAADAVTVNRSAAGFSVPADFDRRLSSGDPTEIKVYLRSSNNLSQEGYNTMLVRMREVETLLRSQPNVTPPPNITLTVNEVRQDPRVNRNQFASALAAMACVLCMGAVSSVTGMFGRGQEQRTLEPMLLLPLPRRFVALGLASGAFPVAVLQLVVAQLLVVAATAFPLPGLQQPLGEVARMMVLGAAAAGLLGALATATGCLAGSIGVGTDDAVSLGDFFALPFVAAGIVLFLSPDLPNNVAVAIVPIVGPMLTLRDAIRGTMPVLPALVSVVSTIGWCALLLRLAGTRIGAERRLARAVS